MPDPQIFKATYSGVPVYEMICKGVAVMRRRSDGWLNATQILKVAGFDKPQRTRVLEREVQKGEHEKVQGGYGKYQGTWVPMDRGISLAKQYSVTSVIQPIVDFVPASNSPPLAPKHVTQPSHRPKRKAPPADASNVATRSKRTTVVAVPEVEIDDGEEDAIGEDDISEIVLDEPVASGQRSEDGTMTTTPSEASSSSRTPSPLGSQQEVATYDPNMDSREMDWTHDPYRDQHGGNRKHRSHHVDPVLGSQVSINQPYSRPIEIPQGANRYGDIILEYFISDSTTIPSILVNPPSDFDANMSIDDDGHTALHWACAMGRVRVVKLLLTAGADIFKVNKGGQTPLMRSVMFSNNYDVRKFPELYELLHRSTLNIDHSNRTVFHHIVDLAMSKGKVHAARYYMETLLNRLSDFPQELADIINFQDEDGETALTLAARCRSKRLVKLLLDHGADPKIRNADGKSSEDYILEDERFRYSPVMRGQSLSFKMPFEQGPRTSNAPGAFGPRLHHSTAAQNAAGKCTQEMAMMLDSLASAFDQELADKDRDLTQAHALLSNIQAEILESERAVSALKSQASALEAEQNQQGKLEQDLQAKMGKRFRLGWEKWIKDEEARDKQWKTISGAATDANGAPTLSSPERRTRAAAGLPTFTKEDFVDVEELYNSANQIAAGGPVAIQSAIEQLKEEITGYRSHREELFEDFVNLSAESGTGGRMAEYRRLIGAGCGGVPPNEVDNVIGILLETLEADEGVLAGLGNRPSDLVQPDTSSLVPATQPASATA